MKDEEFVWGKEFSGDSYLSSCQNSSIDKNEGEKWVEEDSISPLGK